MKVYYKINVIFIGEFKNGQKNGQGILKFYNG